MSTEQRPSITTLILAGGKSRRMNGADKCLLELAGKPLIQHVIDALNPQSGPLYISANSDNAAELEAFNLPIIVDQQSDKGPLSGLCSAMQFCTSDEIAIVPCDSPFVPTNLIEKLRQQRDKKTQISYAKYGEREHYAHSLWSTALLPELEKRLHSNELSLKSLVKNMSSVAVEFEQEQLPPIFFNINTMEDLEQARRYLQIANK